MSDGEVLGGRYRLGELLGSGGFGVVYRAFDSELEVDRAAKVMRQDVAANEVAHARMRREARVMASIRHPSVVAVHDVGVTEDGRPYLVMDLLGETLQDRLDREGPLAPEVAAALLEPIAEGLQRVHEAGVVHRDVKPGNVLFDAHGAPALGDFGVALADDQLLATAAEDRLGSFAFMAPELLDDAGNASVRSDVFALGATLLAACIGRPPYALRDEEDRAELVSGLPPQLARVVLKATAKDPAERYGSATELVAALHAEPEPEPVVVPDEPDEVVVAPRARRWPFAVGAAALVALVALAGRGQVEEATPAVEVAVAPEPVAELPPEPVPVEEPPADDPPADERVQRTEVRPTALVAAPVAAPVEQVDEVEEPVPVEVWINARPWAELSLNGRPLGRTARTVEVVPGEHHLRFSRGEQVVETTLVVDETTSVFCMDMARGEPCPS